MTLNSRQRVLAAFSHQEPDRVPCWLGASPEWKQLARDYLGLADDEALLHYLGDDFRRVFSKYAGPDERSPDKLLSPVAGGKWQVASVKWQVAGGKWQVASGRSQVTGRRSQATPFVPFVHSCHS